jgi:hypothetical protein
MSEVTETTETTEVTEEVVAKRDKKLNKTVEGHVVTIEVIGGELGVQTFDVTTLPAAVQDAFMAFGLGHKLGDAAAGRAGKDAEEAIAKVWDGLVKGDWTVRAPAAPKVKMSEVKNALAGMSEADAAAAKELMAKLGIKI